MKAWRQQGAATSGSGGAAVVPAPAALGVSSLSSLLYAGRRLQEAATAQKQVQRPGPLRHAPHDASKGLAGVHVPRGGLVDGQARVGHALVLTMAACSRGEQGSRRREGHAPTLPPPAAANPPLSPPAPSAVSAASHHSPAAKPLDCWPACCAARPSWASWRSRPRVACAQAPATLAQLAIWWPRAVLVAWRPTQPPRCCSTMPSSAGRLCSRCLTARMQI